MAVPNYGEDLTDIDLCEVDTAFTALGGGGAGLDATVDFAIEGTNSVNKQITGATTKGMVSDYGSPITMGAADHVYVWLVSATPGTMNVLSSGGMRVTVGSALAAYNDYYVNGSDTLPEGGNLCYVVRYETSTPSPGAQTGTPGTNPQWFGGQLTTTLSVKGPNFAVDAIRYGTGAYITDGALATPGTFAGYATVNDADRWGIFASASGGYAWQGRFVVGQDNTQTPAPAYFEDENVDITLTDTPHSQVDFTQLIVDDSGTEVYLTNINWKALGTNNPGKLLLTDFSACELTDCSWTDYGTSTLLAGAVFTTCSWRRCAAIVQAGATITGGSIVENTAAVALLVTDIGEVTDVEFTSDTTGHGIEYAPVGAGPFNVNLSGCQFDAYASSDGITGNEAVLIHPDTNDADITLNIIGGGSTPSIMEHADYTGVFTLVVAPRTITIHCLDGASKADIEGVRVLVTVASGTKYQQAVTEITQTGGTATVDQTGHGLATGNYVLIEGATNGDTYNGVKQITVTGVDAYEYACDSGLASPATGTITSTLVVIPNVLTDSNGEASDTRSWSGDQPIEGFCRKGTSTPTYVTADVTGSISATVDKTIDIPMASDD